MSDPLKSWRGSDVPVPVQTEMENLRRGLDNAIPPKRDANRNLLIATWNIKAFSSLTNAWTASSNDSPKRDWRALWATTEIVSRFDVIAILLSHKAELIKLHQIENAFEFRAE